MISIGGCMRDNEYYVIRNHNLTYLLITDDNDTALSVSLEIKLKMFKNKVTGVDAADENASHNTINTAPHGPNAATAPDLENNISLI